MSFFDLFQNRAAAQAAPAIPAKIKPPARADTNTASYNLSAVFRAIDIIETAASQLSLDAIAQDGTKAARKNTPSWVLTPDPNTTQAEWIKASVASLVCDGNAYYKVLRDKNSLFLGLQLLPPHLCTPILDLNTGRRTVQYNGRSFTPSQLVHVRRVEIPGVAEGLSPIGACRRELKAAADLANYSQNFTRSDVPSGVLTSDQYLSNEQAKEAKERWLNRGEGIAVLGQGTKYTPILLKPADIQFLETRNFDTLAIARMFGIPPRLMSVNPEGGTKTYANLVDEDISFIRWTITSYLRAIEAGFSSVTPGKWRVKFNIDALLRASTLDRYQAHQIALQAGFMTVNEVRKIEGLPPLP